MNEIDQPKRQAEAAGTKLPWHRPEIDMLSAQETANNGLVAPGDGPYSPSPTGS
ncbi:MAG: hypothetical protein ACLGHK_00560 [Alphaproteobacteria bacterium]